MRGHRVGRGDGLDAGVELPLARAAGGHRAGGARVEPADDAARGAQRLEEEGLVADAQVLLLDQRARQAGEFGDALRDARGAACSPAARRRAARPRSRRRRRPRPPRAPPAGDAASGPFSRPWYCADVGEGRQEQRVGQVVGGAKTRLCRSIAHDTRIRPDSATPSACSLSASAGAACGAVALAGQVHRRAPALVPRQPARA